MWSRRDRIALNSPLKTAWPSLILLNTHCYIHIATSALLCIVLLLFKRRVRVGRQGVRTHYGTAPCRVPCSRTGERASPRGEMVRARRLVRSSMHPALSLLA